MPDTDDFDFEDDEQLQGPKALRDALKKAQKALEAAAKRAEEAEARAAKAEKEAKSKSLADLFRDKGVDPRFVKWAEKDNLDATAEAVDGWLKENPEFAPAKKQQQPDTPDGADEADEAGDEGNPLDSDASMDPNLLALLQAEGNLGAQGGARATRDPLQRIAALDGDKFGSYEEYVAALNKELRS